jgi:hypothetical protein
MAPTRGSVGQVLFFAPMHQAQLVCPRVDVERRNGTNPGGNESIHDALSKPQHSWTWLPRRS